MSGHDASPDGLLTGVRVLDLSIWRPGPYATQLLADLGADVIKVEPPGGDPMRIFPELFSNLNANKRSVVLNLHDPAERAHAYELAAEADALVEGFRPGVAARLGMGEAEVRSINPSIVYCSVSGYGQDGPLAVAPGHDLNYQAYAAVLAPDGGPPVQCAVPIADLGGGLAAAMASVRRARISSWRAVRSVSSRSRRSSRPNPSQTLAQKCCSSMTPIVSHEPSAVRNDP